MPDGRVARLVILSPPELAGRVLLLSQGDTVIGRGEGADLVVDGESVSPAHAQITTDSSGTATIRDLTSTSGTYVNGERIDEPRPLSTADVLRLGDVEFRFELAATAPSLSPGGRAELSAAAPPSGDGTTMQYVVTGTVSSPASASIGGLNLLLVDKEVGGDVPVARGRTQPDGRFVLAVWLSRSALAARHKTAPDFQVQVVRDGAVVAASIVRYNAATEEELNVVLPAEAPLASEHEALTASLSALYPGSLVGLEESEKRQDITHLANKSGWDARAVAMASLAAQLSDAAGTSDGTRAGAAPQSDAAGTSDGTRDGSDPLTNSAYYYALLRAGLPSDSVPLHQTDPDVVVSIWKQAATSGVIPTALGDDTAAAREAFIGVAAEQALNAPPLTGPSTLGQLLAMHFGNDTARQQQFADLLVRNRNDSAGLWAAAEQTFGASTSAQLRLLGQLAFLTANNAPLLQALYQAQEKTPLSSPVDLVTAGYYQGSAWEALMGNVPPPAEIPGSTPQEQKANYAELLAAQVRVSFPTATVGHMAAGGLLGADVQATSAGAFLLAHSDFDIGDEPIGRYLTRTGATAAADAVDHITRIQRVYQMTPDATAMAGLLGARLDSAYAITRMRQAAFIGAHGEALGGEEAAQAVYKRARAIHASTLHLALSYLSARRQPMIGSGVIGSLVDYVPTGHTANGDAAPAPAQATLESLFGDLDYCQCNDCQSITSPAAYLVDLLDWINKPTASGQLGQTPRSVIFFQSTYKGDGVHGNFEAIVRVASPVAGEPDHLDFWWFESGSTQWNGPVPLLLADGQAVDGVTGDPVVIQTDWGKVGNFELLVPHGNVIREYFRDNDDPKLPWKLSREFGYPAGPGGQLGQTPRSVIFFQSTYKGDGVHGNFEAIVRVASPVAGEPDHLDFWWFESGSTQWNGPVPLLLADGQAVDGVTGDPVVIQTDWGKVGNFELLVPHGNVIREYFRDNDDPKLPWKLSREFGYPAGPGGQLGQTPRSVIFFQSTYKGDGVHGNFEAIVRVASPVAGEPDHLDFWWFESGSTQWNGPVPLLLADGQAVDGVTGDPVVIQTDWGKVGNFELLVPHGNVIREYFRDNDDPKLPWKLSREFARPALNPREVLLARRLDIGALPLTCENTNVALPYIDLVNETLEYYVGNPAPESLTEFTGYSGDGSVSSAELIASPQNDDNAVARNAYDILKAQWFPPPLPFYRDLELLRQHIGRFGISLHDVMRELRTSESLERPDPQSYGWRDVLAERLGLSRLDYRLLTDGTLTLAQLYGYPVETPSTGPGGVIASVSPLQEFSRRTSVDYDDVVSILRTHFINPGAWLIGLLEAIALPFSTLQALHDGTLTPAEFTAKLPAGLDAAAYGPSGVSAWVLDNFQAISQLIMIDANGAPCDTSAMTLQSLDGSPLAEIDLFRLVRFIRLWRKLTLSIRQTDELISALYESSGPSTAGALAQLDSDFLALLPRAGLAYMAMDLLGLDPSSDLESLLVCWGPIGTGPGSLYERLFLNPTVLSDPVFALDGNGNLFTGAPNPKVLDHRPAICAALNLTEGEFALITGPAPLGLGYDTATALTLDALSAIFRRAWLARALQLSVLELLSLIAATGVDPFAAPLLDAAAPVSAPLLEFTRRAQSLSAANLAPVQALCLLWNEDLSGVSSLSEDTVMGLAASLRGAFAAIDAQFVVRGPVTTNTAKSLMSLVLGTTPTDQFFGLLTNTFPTSITFGYSQPTLPTAVTLAADGRLVYDDLAKRLSFGGYLDANTLAAMQAKAAGDAALLGGLTALAAANAEAVNAFFAAYDDPLAPYLKPLFDAYITSTAGRGAALATLLAGLLPLLGTRRKREQALATAATAAGCAPSFAPPLLGDAAAIPAANPNSAAAAGVSDLTGLGNGGLSVQFFLTNDPTAAPGQTLAVAPSLTYDPDKNPLPAPSEGAGAIAARWSGFISAAQDGDYNLSFAVNAGATVTALTVNGQAAALSSTTTGAVTVWSNVSAIALRAGALTSIQIMATGLTNRFSASWESLGSGWQPIPPQSLYSDVLIGYLRTTTRRFLKATALAADLSLTGAEIGYLATAAGLDVGGRGWLAGLAVDGPAPSSSRADLTVALDGLLAFAALKARYSPLSTQTPQLLDTLKDIAASAPAATSELLSLTGWDRPSLSPLLQRLFNGAPGVTSLTSPPGLLANLRRLQSAFALVTTCRLSASTLIEAATNDPSPTPASTPPSTVLADLQSAVRSRYAEADWLRVVKPINDSLREMQRDALVAYILTQSGPAILAALGIAATPNRLPTADDLFNYFLLDVEMEPCMETSRIRLALSSVQLFIERCLRNLEPGVDPADIDPDGTEWSWRKRYRVWQANREVFLWPENWLEPSLRDDQSPFFKTTMSRLLQSDITDDAAAAAYLDYLSNLEGVAKLDPSGLYYEPAPAGSANDAAHVVARTGGTHRKYYHRRLGGGTWTPWEEIKLSIEDNPVFPYVWNGRLMLFWLQLQHRPATSVDDIGSSLPQSSNALGATSVTDLSYAVAANAADLTSEQVSVVLCFSEYYNGAWQPVKGSDASAPLNIGLYPQGTFKRSQLWLLPFRASDPRDKSLYLEVRYRDSPIVPAPPMVYLGAPLVPDTLFGSGFVVHNTHSAPVTWADVPPTGLASPSHVRELYSAGNALGAAYGMELELIQGHGLTLTVLTGTLPQAIASAQPDVDDQSSMPFFFGDARSVFYVTSSLERIQFRAFDGFGLTPWQARAPGMTAVSISPIVVAEAPPQPGAPVQITDSVITPSVARAALRSDGFRAVLGGGGTVNFGGRAVGITGSVDATPPIPTASE